MKGEAVNRCLRQVCVFSWFLHNFLYCHVLSYRKEMVWDGGSDCRRAR